ncbi:hypothetical protein PTSG_10579 [Salpingoeca rosetta]|uniref:DUF7164 domain-containing protein n=1 Tax=Salpingoeca rosetta (strain ATCC 50818 / BSB-021) TaxID=946362 RepID=F2URR9_SALR5|nr:uncharacterized protein PTSG_10579 [Salpingoeca rosetta]EGD80324.1 hypothetical protein PTSG_10579 [Salpingoeca rosetta]|eukprot:XP_004988114.1 hypothetical protein PTSG_10579 [Salpingoeca rosetta]
MLAVLVIRFSTTTKHSAATAHGGRQLSSGDTANRLHVLTNDHVKPVHLKPNATAAPNEHSVADLNRQPTVVENSAIHSLLYSGSIASFPPFHKLAEPPFFISLVPDNTALMHLCLSHLGDSDLQECSSTGQAARHQLFLLSSDGHIGFEVKGVGHYCLQASNELERGNNDKLGDADEAIHSNLEATKGTSLAAKDTVDTWQFVPGTGLVHDRTGGCLTYHYPSQITLEPCGDRGSQWMLRTDFNNETRPIPRDWDSELAALAERRDRQVKPLIDHVRHVARKTPKLMHRALSRAAKGPQGVGGRRAVVFFMEPNAMLAMQVRWWLKAWHELRLDEADQRMDVLIMGNGDDFESLQSLGCEMKRLGTQTTIPASDAHGVCWLFPFQGINTREPGKHDRWFNSLEVLVNERTRPLLEQYDQLLRADADTLPTPKMRGYWSEKLVLSLNAGYATRYADAKLATLAGLVGFLWQDLRNIGSTFYGPTQSVLHLVELTIAVGELLRKYTFAPGTGCMLPPKLRPADIDCEWGSGLWLGVSLLYSQQIAANHMVGSGFPVHLLRDAQFDVRTDMKFDICAVKMLHVYHNRERFSKLALHDGAYKDFDMSNLDLHVTRDFITYFALTANNQGMNGDVALTTAGDPSLLCG